MSVYALQYARALADVVQKGGLAPAEVSGQLEDFLAAYATSRDLREVLENPSIKLEQKLKVLDALAPRLGLDPKVRNFFAVLLQNERMHAAAEIASEFRHEMNRRLGISEAEVISVRALSEAEKAEIEARAAAMTGTRVQAVYRQDPSLLGGVVLRIGDTVYDGSVRGRLEELRGRMLATQ